MSTVTESNGTDSGLEALVTLLHFQGVAADREQIRHRLGTNKTGASEILRCARDFGLKARACSTKWSRLAKTPLPAIASLRDGRFMVVGQGQRRRSPGAVAGDFPPCTDDARRTGCDLGRRADPDDAPRRIVRHRPPLRHQLVSGRDPQIPAPARRGAAGLVLPAAVRAGLAAVLPGRHRQGAGASLAEHARRAGRSAWSRSRCSRPCSASCAPICSRTPPTASTSSSARGCSAICWRCRWPISRRAASAIPWRGCASWRTSATSSPVRR